MIIVDDQAELVLPEHCITLVRSLTQQYAPHHNFFAFGSRVVRSKADLQRVKPYSDLDLAMVGEHMPLDKMFLLRDALSESDLPMRVDIVNASDLPDSWRISALPF
jgi:hypothetical protein